MPRPRAKLSNCPRSKFAANGVLTTWGPGRHEPGNNLFVFYTYPDGNWIEISGELETIYDRETID